MKNRRMMGLLGGTFDPIHQGHLQLAKLAHDALFLKQVYFIPCRQPLLKEKAEASAAQRLTLLRLAIQDQFYLSIDTGEIDSERPSYTMDTLIRFRKEWPEASLVWILGEDAYHQLPQWHRWQDLLHYTHLAVACRLGFQLAWDPKLEALEKQHGTKDFDLLKQEPAGFIVKLPSFHYEIASSDLRKSIKEGDLNVHTQIPAAVWRYIQSEKLYI